jgi:hypothetical protein
MDQVSHATVAVAASQSAHGVRPALEERIGVEFAENIVFVTSDE